MAWKGNLLPPHEQKRRQAANNTAQPYLPRVRALHHQLASRLPYHPRARIQIPTLSRITHVWHVDVVRTPAHPLINLRVPKF
eukprot:SAG31_NODE_35033_length_327_cov_0.442982_1_plen_81_part_10